jgi:hypothetical protein
MMRTLIWLASYRHSLAALIWSRFCTRCDKRVTRWHWRRCPCLVVSLDEMADGPRLIDGLRVVLEESVLGIEIEPTGLDRIRARTRQRGHLGADVGQGVCQSLGDAFSRKTPT